MDKTKKSNVVVIGAGPAGISFLSELRASGEKTEATLIDKNNYYFPKERITKDPLNLKYIHQIEEQTKNLGVNFICAKVIKVNGKSKKIILDNSEKLEFKHLVVASGATNQKIEAKGLRREGFFYLSEVDPKKIKTLFKIYNEVSLFVTTLAGLNFSLLVNSLGKDVRVMASNLDFLKEDKEKIINTLAEKKISLHLGYRLIEAIGENNIKAVKVAKKPESPGEKEQENRLCKVFSAQLVFADTGLEPNLDFFENSQVSLERKDFFAKYNGIYFIGDAINVELRKQKCYSGNGLKAAQAGKLLAQHLSKEGLWQNG